ncbi:DUF4190 domain-containing protein [Sphaerimonospora cavernae]|uniref:DUF4190 domain-containing protein n=1 Tax=Sphaerimonospora cavernae TaxID=1740611 RepID=A0ABV6UDM2_9ACTN
MTENNPYPSVPYQQPGQHPRPYQAGPHPPPYGYQPMYVQAPPTSGYATASLVMGILGILGGWCAFGIPCFLAVILGHVALSETKNGRKGGHGMAIAGLILGYIVAIPALLIAIFAFGGAILDSTP